MSEWIPVDTTVIWASQSHGTMIPKNGVILAHVESDSDLRTTLPEHVREELLGQPRGRIKFCEYLYPPKGARRPSRVREASYIVRCPRFNGKGYDYYKPARRQRFTIIAVSDATV